MMVNSAATSNEQSIYADLPGISEPPFWHSLMPVGGRRPQHRSYGPLLRPS